MGRKTLRITADTNILLRVIVDDDKAQAESARSLLSRAEQVVIPVPVFCEFAWVLRAFYRFPKDQVAKAIRQYLAVPSVMTDRIAVEAGVDFLESGGDFADGAVAQQGRKMGGVTFASFDRNALRLLDKLGYPTLCP